jgi:hypothetical protein
VVAAIALSWPVIPPASLCPHRPNQPPAALALGSTITGKATRWPVGHIHTSSSMVPAFVGKYVKSAVSPGPISTTAERIT